MSLLAKAAAVVVPVGLVIGSVAYGVSRHHSGSDDTLGQCRTRVGGLSVVVDEGQARNATLIAALSIRRGLPAHAATIALATALQESRLRNLSGGDRDSLGLFQQRPSQGWGSPAELRNPRYATDAFYAALEQVPGYADLPVTEAAQRVQRSAFPTAYAVYERDARAMASAMTGYSPAAFTCHLSAPAGDPPPVAVRARRLRAALTRSFGPTSVRVLPGSRLGVEVSGSPRGWATASYLVAHARTLGLRTVAFAGRGWSAGEHTGWSRQPGGERRLVVVD